MKVYKLKEVPAPWLSREALALKVGCPTVTRVDMENALTSFPRPKQSQGFVDSEGVFIGAIDHNMPTYVLVEDEGRHTWTLKDKQVALWSINGCGECRWVVSSKSCQNNADKQAIEAYGLENNV